MKAMKSANKDKWDAAVIKEKGKMDKHIVFEAVPKDKLPKGSKVLANTWAMKPKANGDYRARLNARGFEQKEGDHYDPDNISAPIVTEFGICITFCLITMAMWHGKRPEVERKKPLKPNSLMSLPH